MEYIFEVKVIPSSGSSKIKLSDSEEFVVYLKSAPEKSKANKELIKLFSKTLRIPQFYINIISGLTTRRKRIKIYKILNKDDLINRLGLSAK